MKPIFAALIVASALVPCAAHAGERVGDAALGALSGAVVLGPVGLVAGAVVGYTAGPSIARSWRNSRHHPRHAARPAKRSMRVAAKPRANPTEAAGEVTPIGKGTGGPPAQGLE